MGTERPLPRRRSESVCLALARPDSLGVASPVGIVELRTRNEPDPDPVSEHSLAGRGGREGCCTPQRQRAQPEPLPSLRAALGEGFTGRQGRQLGQRGCWALQASSGQAHPPGTQSLNFLQFLQGPANERSPGAVSQALPLPLCPRWVLA